MPGEVKKKIVAITLSLSEKNGIGRYSYSILHNLDKSCKFFVFSVKEDLGKRLYEFSNSEFNPILPKVYNFNKLRLLLLPWLIWKIRKKAKDADLIHAMMDYPYSFLAALVARFFRKPLILSAHGTYSIIPFDNFGDRALHKYSLRMAKKIICISSFTEKQLKAHISLNNTIIVNNGIDFDRFNKPQSITKKNFPQIISVGELKNRKGYHITLQAMSEVKKIYHNFRYYIIGYQANHDYHKSLLSIIEKYNLFDNVIFLENLNDDDLVRHYRSSDLFILTPVNIENNIEGFGIVYLEASACGLPVIGTYNCGAEDAIVENVTGLLVNQNDVQATSQAILKLLGNKELARRMGEEGKKRAEKMDWSIITKKYLDIYNEIVNL